jgi:hypothetical protein
MRVVILILATALFALSGSPLLAQREYPATATIRGESIWLRVDPAEDTEIVGYLQRGDQIQVTGEATFADGDAFYPVEVVETGETGWVRELAVDPRSFTPVEELPEVVVEDPPAEETTAEEARPRRNQGRGARPRDETGVVDEPGVEADAEVVVDEPTVEADAEVAVDEPVVEEATPEPAENTTRPRPVISESDGVTTITGTGQQVSDSLTLEPGRYRVGASIEPRASDNFQVHLLGPGDFDELVFNETPGAGERWEGETVVSILEPGEYLFEVNATQDEWTIVIEPA